MKIVFLITLLVSSATAANERLAGRHARASAGAAKPGEEFLKQAALFHQKCSKCHTIGKGDRVGPDLKGVTGKREKNWLVGFISRPGEYLDTDPVAKELLEKYNGVRMDDAGLNAQQAEGLLTYIETFSAGANGGDDEPELLEEESFAKRVVMPDESGGIPLVALALLPVFLAATGWAWKCCGPQSALVLAVLTMADGYWALGGHRHYRYVGNHQGYAPEQPIAFSHKLHAGDMEIACLYCHHGAEKSQVAGVPSLNVCMNCHHIVKKRSKAKEPSQELAKLFEVWESKNTEQPKSLEWVRVHRLPDFVTFSHQSHVQNGLACQECHGPVETMDRIRQASDLSMGWCVNCHRHRGTTPPTHWKRSEATLDCTACHQ